jgi:hypothetical protein
MTREGLSSMAYRYELKDWVQAKTQRLCGPFTIEDEPVGHV